MKKPAGGCQKPRSQRELGFLAHAAIGGGSIRLQTGPGAPGLVDLGFWPDSDPWWKHRASDPRSHFRPMSDS